ncbi:hypothetical protein Tco_0277009 [Tanacetum coccineum]
MARTLIEIKAAKPKAVTTTVTRPKARGVIVQEPSEFTTTTSPSQPSQLPQAKDKGKEKMVEPEKPLKKKDQIMFDKEAQEQEELTIEERSKMFVEHMDKRKKHFARLRAEERRRKPPTKAQKRNTMSTYLKNMAGYKHNQLKTKSFEDIQIQEHKLDENVEAEVDDEAELKKHMEIVPDDEVAIYAIPLATKPPIIIDWKIIKEGKMGYF